jgi:hypothetical protein
MQSISTACPLTKNKYYISIMLSPVVILCGILLLLTSSVSSLGSCAAFTKPVNSSFPYGFLIGMSIAGMWNETSSKCKTYHPNATTAIFRDKDSYDLSFTLHNAANLTNVLWVAAQNLSSDWFWSDGVPLFGDANNTRYFKWSGNWCFHVAKLWRHGRHRMSISI